MLTLKSKYLFSDDMKLQSELNDGKVPKDWRSTLHVKKAALYRTANGWMIAAGSNEYFVGREGKVLNVYDMRPRTPPIPNKHGADAQEGDIVRHGIVVFPSLHYVVVKTGEHVQSPNKAKRAETEKYEPESMWGIDAFKKVLPRNLQDR